jgi:hypothetical protein
MEMVLALSLHILTIWEIKATQTNYEYSKKIPKKALIDVLLDH